MLREIPHTRQHPEEPHRRWFHSAEQDLYVWQDADSGEFVAFQLCYGKNQCEHAIDWRADKGFAHLRVNGGDRVLTNQTPLLVADGEFPVSATLARFLELAAALPPDIVALVRDRLTRYPD